MRAFMILLKFDKSWTGFQAGAVSPMDEGTAKFLIAKGFAHETTIPKQTEDPDHIQFHSFEKLMRQATSQQVQLETKLDQDTEAAIAASKKAGPGKDQADARKPSRQNASR